MMVYFGHDGDISVLERYGLLINADIIKAGFDNQLKLSVPFLLQLKFSLPIIVLSVQLLFLAIIVNIPP